MNIVHILGNGFDINLGLKTQYTDFYTYLKTLDVDNVHVETLRNRLKKDYETWSDMEKALGDFTSEFESVEKFIEFFEDISNLLLDYLKMQEDQFDFSTFDLAKLQNDLAFPEQYLVKSEVEGFESFNRQWINTSWNVRIISLNYTRTLEKIFNRNDFDFGIAVNQGGHAIKLKGIEHLHGYHDERVIFGVNDVSQIRNNSFRLSDLVQEAFVKPMCNSASGDIVDRVCMQQIANANLICVFGCSLGVTDSFWWDLIGQQLKGNCKMILFVKGREIDRRRLYKKAQPDREIKAEFLNRTTLTENEKQVVVHKIYVVRNAHIFKI